MWRRAAAPRSRLLILRLRFRQHSFADVRTHELRRIQVNPPTEDFRKLLLYREERKPRHAPRLELDQHVHVAVGTKVIAQHRAEEGQPADVVLSAEVGDLFTVNRDANHLGLSGFPSSAAHDFSEDESAARGLIVALARRRRHCFGESKWLTSTSDRE